MRYELLFADVASKYDVNISLENDGLISMSVEEQKAFNIIADYLNKCTLAYLGKNSENYITVKKTDESIVVEINESYLKKD